MIISEIEVDGEWDIPSLTDDREGQRGNVELGLRGDSEDYNGLVRRRRDSGDSE